MCSIVIIQMGKHNIFRMQSSNVVSLCAVSLLMMTQLQNHLKSMVWYQEDEEMGTRARKHTLDFMRNSI